MTFWEHLEDLRGVLFKSLIAIVVMMVVIFFAKDFIFGKIIFAPIRPDFVLYEGVNYILGLLGISAWETFSMDLINIDLAAQFFIHLKVTFFLSFVVAVPYVLFLLWGFISPALYANEQSSIRRAFSFGAILFFLGVVVGYVMVFPLTLRFLGTYQVSADVPNQISLNSYISMFLRLVMVMGLVFEMPALAAILSRMGIITKELLKKYRRHAVIVLMILAAIITPSGDIFTLTIVGVPLYLLYEFSIVVCKPAKENDE